MMTTQQISEQVRQLILDGELDDAANALVQFFDEEYKSLGNYPQTSYWFTFQPYPFNHPHL